MDLSHEPVHLAALESLGHRRAPGDAAVVLVLKRLADARRDGNAVHAVLAEDEAAATLALGDASGGLDLERIFGAPHAATGLLHVAAGALALRHRARPRLGAWATPWFGERRVEVAISTLEAPPRAVRLAPGDCVAWLGIEAPPRLHVYSGRDREGALVALEARRESDAGPARLVLVAADGDEFAARADAAQRWLRRGGPPPEGVAFRERPVDGELAFVFTGAAAAYPGMGRDLALGLPGLVDAVAARCEEMRRSTDWLYGPGDGTPAHPLDQLWGTSFVCQLHAELSRGLLGLSPRATLGYSSGESNALFALGRVDRPRRDDPREPRRDVFTRELAGAFDAPRRAWARLGLRGETWANYIVSAPVEHVRSALAGEPLAHLTIINTPEDCVIGGEASACERVLARLGRGRALPLGYDIAAHCPELQEVHAEWRALHHRATRDVPGVRFYTHATGSWFHPTADAAADAITGQAARTLDFPRLVEQAWADGVRVFLEHGPRGLCSGWIKRILGERDHIAVPLDVQGRSGLRQAMNAAAWLLAAGVDVHARALEEALSASLPPPRAPGRRLTLAAHAPAPRLPAFEPRVQVMARAPRLHPVLADPMLGRSRRRRSARARDEDCSARACVGALGGDGPLLPAARGGAPGLRAALGGGPPALSRAAALDGGDPVPRVRRRAARDGLGRDRLAARDRRARRSRRHAWRRGGDRAGTDHAGVSDHGAGASAFDARTARADVRSRAAGGARERPDFVGVRARVCRAGRLPPPGPHAGAAAAPRRSRDRHRRDARAARHRHAVDRDRRPRGQLVPERRRPDARRNHDRGRPGRSPAHQLDGRRLPSTAASASTACSAAS